MFEKLVRNFKPVKEFPGGSTPPYGYYQDIMREGGVLYLRRHFLGKYLGMTFFLHHFVSEDQDEWVHDHPWRFCLSLVLSGWYMEERVKYFDPIDGYVSKMKKVKWINWLLPRTFHRVAAAQPGTWTLFVHFGRMKEWGFFERKTLPMKEEGKEAKMTDVVVYHQPFLGQYIERARKRRSKS